MVEAGILTGSRTEAGAVTREKRPLAWGGEDLPKRGTLFSQVELEWVSVARELARLIMEQVVDEQAGAFPRSAGRRDGWPDTG